MARFRLSFFCVALLLALSACAPQQPLPQPPRQRLSTTPPHAAATQAMPTEPSFKEVEGRLPAHLPVVRVGLLLPLSGESQALGQSMLDAAMLALYDGYVSLRPEQIRAKLVLIPKDTGTSPSNAAFAAEQAVSQGAGLLVGPVYGAAAAAAAPVARRHNVPVLSLSNNKAVAGAGVYVFGFLPEQQIKRVADYLARNNVSSLGALLPNDAYGGTVAAALEANLSGKGIKVEPVEMYARSPANLEAAAMRLKNAYDMTPFPALFIADGGDALKRVLAAVQAQGIRREEVRFIGSGLWDDEEVRNNPDMLGAWFASSPPGYYNSFERRFAAAYGYKPQRLASLAYDAVALAAKLTVETGGDFSAGTLTRPQGYTGPANGLYRLHGDGTAERALAVLEITPSGVKTLNAAPLDFE